VQDNGLFALQQDTDVQYQLPFCVEFWKKKKKRKVHGQLLG